MTGLWIAAGAVVFAVVFGLYRAATDGRFGGTHQVKGGPEVEAHEERIDVWRELGTAAAVDMGERATLVQFSSAFCAPCRVTRRILQEVAQGNAGVHHVEVDAEHHLEVVRRLGIMRTPTTLILDPSGREVGRAVGAPTTTQVYAALAAL